MKPKSLLLVAIILVLLFFCFLTLAHARGHGYGHGHGSHGWVGHRGNIGGSPFMVRTWIGVPPPPFYLQYGYNYRCNLFYIPGTYDLSGNWVNGHVVERCW